jgi:hypothetical protein
MYYVLLQGLDPLGHGEGDGGGDTGTTGVHDGLGAPGPAGVDRDRDGGHGASCGVPQGSPVGVALLNGSPVTTEGFHGGPTGGNNVRTRKRP